MNVNGLGRSTVMIWQPLIVKSFKGLSGGAFSLGLLRQPCSVPSVRNMKYLERHVFMCSPRFCSQPSLTIVAFVWAPPASLAAGMEPISDMTTFSSICVVFDDLVEQSCWGDCLSDELLPLLL